MVLRLRGSLKRFLDALDSEGVGLFQAIVYLHLAAAGFYCAVIATNVLQTVEEAMGPDINAVWLWLLMGVTLCLLGKTCKGGLAYAGLWLQLVGDVFAVGGFGGYVIATLQTAYWGKAVVAVWVFAGLAECAALLVLRDVRRIGQVERIARR